jgi:hypothetical protein
MHYSVYVFIPRAGDIDALVALALEPYCEDVVVPPYKAHLDAGEIQAMATYYGVKQADLNALALRMEKWKGIAGGVDDKGLFVMKTWNPEGKWDWYEVGGRWNGRLRGNVLSARTLLKKPNLRRLLPACMVTPDGSWHESETFIAEGWTKWRVERKGGAAWLAEVRAALRHYPDHRVVCVDIHS